MHPYLTKLGVRPEVQEFFAAYYHSDPFGNLVFPYPDAIEHFGFAFHRIPASKGLWMAGNGNFATVDQVFISSSAMDALAYLQLKFDFLRDMASVLFISTGAGTNLAQSDWVRKHLQSKRVSLLFSKDFLGRMWDLKMAAGIRQMPVAILALPNEEVEIIFRNKRYLFRQEEFSLNSFGKAAGYRFNLKTLKPKSFNCFFDQLKANSPLTF